MSPINRRRLLAGVVGLGVVGAAGAVAVPRLRGDDRDVALVYRGPAALPGCPEAVAALLESSSMSLRAVYVGPDEESDVTAETLAGVRVYAQPGGGTLRSAWRHTRAYTPVLREWVRGGGTYLGFCLGAYLAGDDPGFALFPGKVQQYIGTDDASVDDTDATVVEVDWRAERRHMYFQDGPTFSVPGDDWAAVGGVVLARYPNGAAAATVTPFGTGRVGLVGPHPEADESWYRSEKLTNPDGIRPDLGHDLVATALTRR